jgi:hypothetical protein
MKARREVRATGKSATEASPDALSAGIIHSLNLAPHLTAFDFDFPLRLGALARKMPFASRDRRRPTADVLCVRCTTRRDQEVVTDKIGFGCSDQVAAFSAFNSMLVMVSVVKSRSAAGRGLPCPLS